MFKCGHWSVYKMALHVVLLQGLGALTNDATAKSWENHIASAPGKQVCLSGKQTHFGPGEGGTGCRDYSFLSLGSPDGKCLHLDL